MTHDEMIEVIKAHKEGKKLQCRPKRSGKFEPPWMDFEEGEEPVWNFQYVEYRVKPEPLVFYARVDDNGLPGCFSQDRGRVESYRREFGGRIIKLQEVEE